MVIEPIDVQKEMGVVSVELVVQSQLVCKDKVICPARGVVNGHIEPRGKLGIMRIVECISCQPIIRFSF